MEFDKPKNWKKYLLAIQTLEDYHNVLGLVFSDGVVNEGRLRVMETFTEELCLQLERRIQDIHTHFTEFKNNHRTQSTGSCVIL